MSFNFFEPPPPPPPTYRGPPESSGLVFAGIAGVLSLLVTIQTRPREQAAVAASLDTEKRSMKCGC